MEDEVSADDGVTLGRLVGSQLLIVDFGLLIENRHGTMVDARSERGYYVAAADGALQSTINQQ